LLLPENAPQGLCPACLIKTALADFSFPQPASFSKKRDGSKAKTVVGDYELIEEIARGGMGIVFRARQLSLNRIVAVKALLFGEFASDPFIARFRAEAQAAAALQHPNIVAIHEVWEHSGQHFFSMEFVDGQTLAQIIKEGPLPSKRAARYVTTIARAVHYAHSRGIIHRDLKPSNVLIDSSDQPRITDFGLAKRFGADAAQSVTGVVGSPHYMSPEQAGQRGAQLGPATDVYSIGAILYHMLAGRPPFVGETMEEVLAQTLQSEPISPRLLNASVPRDLETICLKCLLKDPHRRYASAEELADDLDRFLQNKPILARAITPAERIVRWCRRNPAPTALLVLLAIVATASSWGSQHFRHLNQTIRIGQYVSDMNAAIHYAEEGDNGHAIALLNAHVPKGKEPDLRGFEWRHMWWLCRGNYENWLPTHPQVVGAIHYTGDGQKSLTFAWDSTARLYEMRSRQNLLTIKNVSAIGSFNPDETSFLVNRPDGALQWLDAKTGATNQVVAARGQLVAYSRASQVAAILDTNNHLKIWNIATAHELLTIPDPPPAKTIFSWNTTSALSPDGSRLALLKPNFNPALPTRAVRIFDLAKGIELDSLAENRELRCLAFSQDGAWLVTGDGEGSVRRWNLKTREFKDIPNAHTVPVLTIAFAPDSKTFATGSSDQHCIRLWDLETCEAKESEFLGQAGDVWSLAFTPDGKQLASGTRDGIIRIWSVNPPKIRSELADLNTAEFGNFVFSPDSRFIAAGCSNRTVTVWNASNFEMVVAIPRVNYVVAFSADNRRVLVADHDWHAFWFDIEKRTIERVPAYGGSSESVISVAIAPDRRYAALGLSKGGIALVDMTTGMPARPVLKGHSGAVQSVAFSPNGQKLASGGSDMNVMVWDVKTGASLGVCQEHKAGVSGLTISPDGNTLASGCGAETIKLWDVNHLANRSWMSASSHRSAIRALSFSPDSRTLASGSGDRTVKLWNFAALSASLSRREVATFLFKAPLRAVLFSPDGNTLAAVTEKGELRLFRANSLEECDKQLREIR
jgi:WD40 repeat protein